MQQRSQTAAQPVRLRFGSDVPCPACRGKGKQPAVFDPQSGHWYRPKCLYCRGRAIVPVEFAESYHR